MAGSGRALISGESLAALRLKLANETSVEVPARAYHLELLPCALMEAFPIGALAHPRQRLDDVEEPPASAESARRCSMTESR